MRIGVGTAPVVAILQNDGVLGSINGIGDGIILEASTQCSSLTIMGSGVTSIARFRPMPANVSATPPVLNVFIDQNMVFGYNNTCFTGFYNSTSNTAGETTIITINAGKTVTLSNPLGTIHAGNTITNQQGSITYNIYGILDLSATTFTHNFVPHSTVATANATMNIYGTLKLGTGGLNTVSTATGALGSSKINIKNGGLIDATISTALTTTAASNGCFFVVEGSGILKRSVTSLPTIFPIGTSVNSYNPVTLTNTGTEDSFAIGVSNTFSNPLADPSKAVTKQWNITADNAGNGSNIEAAFGWSSADQGVNFLPTSALNIANYSGTTWTGTASSAVSGTGTLTDPYTTTAPGFISYGNFAVVNANALPLTTLSFNAGFENNQVNTWWLTTNENNLSAFVVERSIDGKNFVPVGSAKAKNIAGNNSYSFVDVNIEKVLCKQFIIYTPLFF